MLRTLGWYAYGDTCVHIHTRARMHMHTHASTHTRACVRTHTHTYMYVLAPLLAFLSQLLPSLLHSCPGAPPSSLLLDCHHQSVPSHLGSTDLASRVGEEGSDFFILGLVSSAEPIGPPGDWGGGLFISSVQGGGCSCLEAEEPTCTWPGPSTTYSHTAPPARTQSTP